MISALLRTKIGVCLMALVVIGVFFTLSRLKARRSLHPPRSVVSSTAQKAGVEDAALLKRSQETVRAKAEDLQAERALQRSLSKSNHGLGDVYRRRAAPSPVEGQIVETERSQVDGDRTATPLVLPSLRIRGRKNTAEPRNPVKRALDAVLPKVPGLLPELPGNPLRSPFRGEGDGASGGPQIPASAPDRFVPFGRLIKAELVMTLESSQEEMPLVGLITDPVYNNGRLVIPAGTEIHSTARPSRLRDRILSGSEWHMIFPREGLKPNGRQLKFRAVALDREDQDANGLTWPLGDGSPGLRGRIIRNGQTREEVMIFAAEALKAASATLMEREATVAGSRLEANAKNAALAGGQAVLARVTQGILQELELNGAYVQVPAGKQFYVYPKQVIDPDRADIPASVAQVE